MSKRSKIEMAVHYCILALIAVLFILPLLWMFIASVDTTAIQALRLPSAVSAENYRAILLNPEIRRSFGIGFLISGGQSLLVVLLCILAAYPLSRFQLKYKKSFMMTVLFLTSLPITAVIVPVFQLFLYLRFQDSSYY